MDLKEAIDPLSAASLEKNAASISYVRHLTSLASGCAAGCLRLESLAGFGFYFLTSLIVTLLLLVFTGSPSRYFRNPWKALVWDDVITALPGFVLAWSLTYSIVET